MGECTILKRPGIGGNIKIYLVSSTAGTSFNVVSVCTAQGIDYTKLTVDDFFFTPYQDSNVELAHGTATYASCSIPNCWCESTTGQGSHNCGSGSVTSRMNKSYNAATGDLTVDCGVNSFVYIVPDSEQLITESKILTLLTDSSGIDISTIDTKGYSEATTKNMLFRTIPSVTDTISCCCSYRCPVGVTFNKDYTSNIFTNALERVRDGYVYLTSYYFGPKQVKYIE